MVETINMENNHRICLFFDPIKVKNENNFIIIYKKHLFLLLFSQLPFLTNDVTVVKKKKARY